MSHHRFLVQDLTESTIALGARESRHLKTVLRLKKGECVILFDGRGQEALAEIMDVGRAVVVQLRERLRIEREMPLAITVAAACPKGERLEWMVAKLTELGAAAFIPLWCARSVVPFSRSKKQRLERIVGEASKQCGRARLMAIQSETRLESLCAEFRNYGAVFLATPLAEASLLSKIKSVSVRSALILIGPEGDFTDDEERRTVEAGAVPVKLSRVILRVETAAVAALAICAQACEAV